MAAKRGRGRPRKPPHELKRQRAIGATDASWENWQIAAMLSGMTRDRWIETSLNRIAARQINAASRNA